MPRGELRDDNTNVERRLTRLEQILPTLATKADFETAISAAVAPLATKAELDEKLAAAIAPLATKAELAAAIAPLATKAELAAAIAPLATKAEMREENERTRDQMKVLIEAVHDDVRIVAEGLVSLRSEMKEGMQRLDTRLTHIDGRVTRLEVGRSKRR
jgi:hypothetical protein